MKKRLDLLTVENIEFSLFDSNSPVVDEGVIPRSRVRREAEIDLDFWDLSPTKRHYLQNGNQTM